MQNTEWINGDLQLLSDLIVNFIVEIEWFNPVEYVFETRVESSYFLIVRKVK